MPVFLTPIRNWPNVNGPAPGNAITSALFINNWIQPLMNRIHTLKSELHSVQTLSMVTGAGGAARVIQPVDSRVLHLTALDTDITDLDTRVFFGAQNPEGYDASQRTVVLDKLSKGAKIEFFSHLPVSIYSYTATQEEFGLVFEFSHTSTPHTWKLIRKTSDALRGDFCDTYFNFVSSPSIVGVGAKNLAISGDPISGSGTVQMIDPVVLGVIHTIHVRQINSGATLTISSPSMGSFYTYTAQGDTQYVRISLLSGSGGWSVISVSNEPRPFSYTSQAAPGSSSVVDVADGLDQLRITTNIGVTPVSYRLPNGKYDGQKFALHATNKTASGALSLVNAGTFTICQTTGTGNFVSLKAVWFANAWHNDGVSIGL